MLPGPTAQLVALACHFNGLARGLPAGNFFPTNSTTQFCESVEFFHPLPPELGPSTEWELDASTPDEWLALHAKKGHFALLFHQPTEEGRHRDRTTAGLVGGGGRWLLMETSATLSYAWVAGWEVGDQDAVDDKSWRVRYGLAGKYVRLDRPRAAPLDALQENLRLSLDEILTFAERHRLDQYADRFRQAIVCLSADEPFNSLDQQDLAPPSLLALPGRQLLAASQTAWVFGAMGSWNDLSFDGKQQTIYERVSEQLFSLLNKCLCAAVNSAASEAI